MFGKYFVQKYTEVGQHLFFHQVLCFVATLKLNSWNIKGYEISRLLYTSEFLTFYRMM